MLSTRRFPWRRAVAPGSVRRRRRIAFDCLEPRELLATFTVTNTADSGAHSLRWAILEANVNPGRDTIAFDIIDDRPIKSIRLKSALPEITHTVTINGYTQPLSKPNTLGAGLGDDAIILIQVEAESDRVHSGLVVAKGENTVIEGLSVVGFSKGAGILLKGGRRRGSSGITWAWAPTPRSPRRGTGSASKSKAPTATRSAA